MARQPLLIAMKGEPCTGKSTVADAVSEQLGCLVLDLDDVRDSITIHTKTLAAITPEYIDDQSFESVCRIALPLLQLGQDVIVDSPLPRRRHLDRLLHLTTLSPGSKLVILECKPDQFPWRQWVERRGKSDDCTWGIWYKPTTWDDLEDMLKGSGGSSVYGTDDVPKLVINSAGSFRAGGVAFAVKRLAKSNRPHCIEFHAWMDKLARGLIEDKGAGTRMEPKMFKPEDDPESHYFHYHQLQKRPIANEDGKMVCCRGCLEPIDEGPAYKCKECELHLHVSCAELPSKTMIKPQDYPVFLKEAPHQYSFPKTIKCSYCESHNGDFDECPECLFEAFIRSAELPAVLHHPCHEHVICVLIVPISFRTEFLCRACGKSGHNIRYHCYECGFECHLTCGLLPHAHKQMRHLHRLSITYLSEHADSEDEFLCDACETYRNPKDWIYYCEKCEFASHLSCMAFDG